MKVLVLIFCWICGIFGFLAVMVPLQWLFGTIRAPGRVALVSGVLGIVMLGVAILGTFIYDRLNSASRPTALKGPE